MIHQKKPPQDFNTVFQFLVSNSILPENYPKSGILSQQQFKERKHQLWVVKFAYDQTLKQDTIDLVQNVLYTKNGNQLSCYKFIPSV